MLATAWEFESPLRHHKNINGLAKNMNFANPLFYSSHHICPRSVPAFMFLAFQPWSASSCASPPSIGRGITLVSSSRLFERRGRNRIRAGVARALKRCFSFLSPSPPYKSSQKYHTRLSARWVLSWPPFKSGCYEARNVWEILGNFLWEFGKVFRGVGGAYV